MNIDYNKWIIINLDKVGIDETLHLVLENRRIANENSVPLIKQAVFTNSDDIMLIEEKFDSTGAIVIDCSGKTFTNALVEFEKEVRESQELIEEQRKFQGF